MLGDEVNLALRLLDDQLIDSDDERCGRADDVELEGAPGEETRVSGLLVGASAWPARLPRPLSGALEAVVAGTMVHVPFELVENVSTTLKLSKSTEELGLGTKDGRNIRWVNQPTPGRIRLSSLIARPVRTEAGDDLGRVWEVRARRPQGELDAMVRGPWVVYGLLVGRRGLLERVGLPREEREEEAMAEAPQAFIPWERVRRIAPDHVVAGR